MPDASQQQGQRIGELGYQPPHLARLNAAYHAAAVATAERFRPIVEPLVQQGAATSAIGQALARAGLRTRRGAALNRTNVLRLLTLLGLKTRAQAITAEAFAESIRDEVAALLDRGMTASSIAEELNDRGHTSRYGRPIRADLVRDVMRRLGLKPAGRKVQHG